METHNIISTPDITGNIGSCTTKAEKVIIEVGFFTESGQTIATNSCTGKVEIYPYSSIVYWPIMVIVCFTIFIGMIIVGASSDNF